MLDCCQGQMHGINSEPVTFGAKQTALPIKQLSHYAENHHNGMQNNPWLIALESISSEESFLRIQCLAMCGLNLFSVKERALLWFYDIWIELLTSPETFPDQMTRITPDQSSSCG